MKFRAVIHGVHIDPKKGIVKIQLVATSYISLDELATVGPKDESIHVTFESEQTKVDYEPKTGDAITIKPEFEGGHIIINEEAAAKLKEAQTD